MNKEEKEKVVNNIKELVKILYQYVPYNISGFVEELEEIAILYLDLYTMNLATNDTANNKLKEIKEYCKNNILKDYINDDLVDCCDKEKSFMANELLEIINGGKIMKNKIKVLIENIKLLQKYLDKEITEEEFRCAFHPYTLDEVLSIIGGNEDV